MTIGERIKQRREELGWSQEQLDQAVHVDYCATASLESGAVPLEVYSVFTAIRLAHALGVSLDWLLTGEQGPTNATGLTAVALDQLERQLVLLDEIGGGVVRPHHVTAAQSAAKNTRAVLAEGDSLIAAVRELIEASTELLGLIDDVPIDPKLGDETDRVFPRYEFTRLRAALVAVQGTEGSKSDGTE